MTLVIWDEDVTSSDKVAETIIKLSALAVNGGIDDWFAVQYKGKNCGNIHLKGEWYPDGGAGMKQPKGATATFGQGTINASIGVMPDNKYGVGVNPGMQYGTQQFT